MQLSPLQMDELRFIHVKIEPRVVPDLTQNHEQYQPFRFGNTRFGSHIEHVCAIENEESPVTNFIVALTIQLPDGGENPPPYVVDAKCVGYFSIKKSAFPDFERRYDIGVVNGASLLYGALRDLIATTTARSWYGQLMLPALNFQDNAPSLGGHEVVEPARVPVQPAKKAASRKRPAAKKTGTSTS